MSSLTSGGSSAVLQTIRIGRWASAGIGSASCRRATWPATMPRPSRPHRRCNGCCGQRHHHWTRRTFTCTARCPTPHAATPPQPTSGSSMSRRWPPTTDSSRSGRSTAPSTLKTAPRWWARRAPASQAVAGELVLDTLVETLLRTALEHAGAERGLLIVPRGGDLAIQAEATTSGSAVRVRLGETPVSAAALPASVVRYAARTHEHVLLDDAAVQHPFATDVYLRAQHARSVLCVPLVKQGALVALLYLENH